MKIILLAAGIGSRISPHIGQEHKCLLPLPQKHANSMSLIAHTVESFLNRKANEIHVLTGYKHQKLEEILSHYEKVHCIHNPFYYLVNSIGSLWFAKNVFEHSSDDLIIMNADTFLEENVYDIVFNSVSQWDFPMLLVDSSRKDTADVKVVYDANNVLEQYTKERLPQVKAESVDVVYIPQKHVTLFYILLKNMLEQQRHDTWWESILLEFFDNPVKVIDIAGNFWREIDYIEDYQSICDYLQD